jgi:hypothetical protein
MNPEKKKRISARLYIITNILTVKFFRYKKTDICHNSHHNNVLPSTIMVQLHVQMQNAGIWTIDEGGYVTMFWFLLLWIWYWCCKGYLSTVNLLDAIWGHMCKLWTRRKMFLLSVTFTVWFQCPLPPANAALPSTYSHMTLCCNSVLLPRVVNQPDS